MYISSFYIDKFGVFAEKEFTGLSEGLTIFYGENEAGKTTLLNFVRGMLFGSEKGITAPYISQSETAGGALNIKTKNGEYRIERSFGKGKKDKSFKLILLPAGDEGSEERLWELFGNINSALFKTVYAFGLDDYPIGDRSIFERIKAATAGVGGISPYEIQREFETASENIYTPRKRSGGILDLRESYQEKRLRLDEFLKNQQTYDSLHEQIERRREEAAGLKHKIEERLRERTRLRNLINVWDIWAELVEERKKLENFKINPLIAEKEAEIESAINELQSYVVNNEKLLKERLEEKSEKDALRGMLKELGAGTTEENIEGRDTSLTVEESLKSFQALIEKAAREYEKALSERENAEKNRADAAKRVETVKSEIKKLKTPAIASRDDLNSIELDIQKLRDLVNRSERIVDKLKNLDIRRSELSEDEGETRISTRLIYAPAVAVSFLMAAVAAGLFALNPTYGLTALAAALLLSAALFAASLFVEKHIRRESAGAGKSFLAKQALIDQEAQELNGELQRTRRRINEITTARNFALGDQYDMTNIELEFKKLEEEFLHWSALNAKLHSNENDLEQKEAELNAALKRLEDKTVLKQETEKKWTAWLERLEFPTDLSISGAERFLHKLKEAQMKSRSIRKLAENIRTLSSAVSSFESRALKLLEDCGDGEVSLSEIPDKLLKLKTELSAYSEKHRLQNEITNKEMRLEEISGKDAKKRGELEAELSSYSKTDLEEMERMTDNEITEYEKTKSEAEREIGALTRELELLASKSPSQLLLEMEMIKEEMNKKAREWLSYRLAASVIRKTLSDYAEKRQPLIQRCAEKAFKTFTQERYREIVMQSGEKDLEVEVVAANGARRPIEELSRGTQEQLYLAVRFGLIAELSQDSDPLPIVMDDILVNFDPNRAMSAAKALKEFADKRQILFFTCHPETREFLRNEGDEDAPVKLVNL
ncbi:MAG: hypothetical protein Kow0090_13580 [Myxococcota bacterium]